MSVADLKKLADNTKLIIGIDQTVRELKKGTLQTIFISQNCPPAVRETIETNAQLFKIDVDVLDISNEEMGVIAKKPFAISVISLLK